MATTLPAVSTMATLTTALVTAAMSLADGPTATASTAATTSTAGYGAGFNRENRPTDNRTGVIIGVISFILPFTTAVVLLRFYTRHYLSRAIGADDWVMLAALVLAIVDGIMMLLMTTQGLGHHMWTLTSAQIQTYNMYFYLSIVFYYSCLGTVKTAILLQYLRIFAVKMRKITMAALVLIGLWSTALVLVSILACRPVQGFWDKHVAASCVPDLPQWYVNAAGNIATDIIIFTLPIPVLWHLNLPRSQRLSLIGIFCLGFFTCAISVIRISFLNLNGDDTYANVAAACWSIGELCCAIVCSSLPTLRPVFFRLLPGSLRHHYHLNHPNHHIAHALRHDGHRHGDNYDSSCAGAGATSDARRWSARPPERVYLDSPETIESECFRLKSIRSAGTTTLHNQSPLPSPHQGDNSGSAGGSVHGIDGHTVVDNARTTDGAVAALDSRGGASRLVGGAASYYNRFHHHFHPSVADAPVGLGFTGSTSRLHASTPSLASGRQDPDRRRRYHDRRRRLGGSSDVGSDSSSDSDDLDLDRYMQWAGRDYYRQKYHRPDPEKKVMAVTVAETVAPITSDHTPAAASAPGQSSLSATSSFRSLRDFVNELAGPLVGLAHAAHTTDSAATMLPQYSSRASRSSSPQVIDEAAAVSAQGQAQFCHDSHSITSSAETLTRPAVMRSLGRDHDATFFSSDDDDSSNNRSPRAAKSKDVASAASAAAAGGSTHPVRGIPTTSAASSAAPTQTHSPAPPPSPTPPTRSYSYGHLRRMAAAVSAGVGAAVSAGISVGVGSGKDGKDGKDGGDKEKHDGSSGSGSGSAIYRTAAASLPTPVISPVTSLIPGDPQAMDREAYLGLRQGTITSIEANRPSTAEAEAIGWELPTGPGIQIRREVAQNVGPA